MRRGTNSVNLHSSEKFVPRHLVSNWSQFTPPPSPRLCLIGGLGIISLDNVNVKPMEVEKCFRQEKVGSLMQATTL